jgi:hypothetical protein
MSSPYQGKARQNWPKVTRRLVAAHPLDRKTIVDVVLAAWDSIFKSKLGAKRYRIGVHIRPKPQMMGFLLHELIALELATRYPDAWRGEQSSDDKDLVYIPNPRFSIEVKTSSNRARIFGNRSYAHKGSSEKKSKDGYCLAVNFEKFAVGKPHPRIVRVRFGWLDHTDWQGQNAATGQQARLDPAVERAKLVVLHPPEN